MLLADIRGYINLSPPCTISMDSYSARPDKGLLDIYITNVQELGLPRFPGAPNCENTYIPAPTRPRVQLIWSISQPASSQYQSAANNYRHNAT